MLLMRELEDTIAAVIESTLAAEESRMLGTRTRRDGLDGTGLEVDFTYEDSEPPVALEITSVQDNAFLSAASEARKLAERLTKAASREGWPPFRITISQHADMLRIESPLMDLIRSGKPIRVGDYTSKDLQEWEADGLLEENLNQHKALDSLGIAEAVPAPNDPAVSVWTWGENAGGWAPLGGLDGVASANIKKLVAVGPFYEKHLGIAVGKYRVSQFANVTPVPRFPAGLDRLWLVHLWNGASGKMQIWSAAPEEGAWRVHQSQRPPSGS